MTDATRVEFEKSILDLMASCYRDGTKGAESPESHAIADALRASLATRAGEAVAWYVADKYGKCEPSGCDLTAANMSAINFYGSLEAAEKAADFVNSLAPNHPYGERAPFTVAALHRHPASPVAGDVESEKPVGRHQDGCPCFDYREPIAHPHGRSLPVAGGERDETVGAGK